MKKITYDTFFFRFLPENSADRPASAFIPFGIGNRSCIGNRLALLEMKVVVIQALKKYRIEKCEETIVSFSCSFW